MQHLLVSTRATPLRRKSTLPAQQALTLLREKPAVQFSCRTSRATFPLAACKNTATSHPLVQQIGSTQA